MIWRPGSPGDAAAQRHRCVRRRPRWQIQRAVRHPRNRPTLAARNWATPSAALTSTCLTDQRLLAGAAVEPPWAPGGLVATRHSGGVGGAGAAGAPAVVVGVAIRLTASATSSCVMSRSKSSATFGRVGDSGSVRHTCSLLTGPRPQVPGSGAGLAGRLTSQPNRPRGRRSTQCGRPQCWPTWRSWRRRWWLHRRGRCQPWKPQGVRAPTPIGL